MQSTASGDYQTIFAVRKMANTGWNYLFATPVDADFSIRLDPGENKYLGRSDLEDLTDANDWTYSGSMFVNSLSTLLYPLGIPHIATSIASGVVSNTYGISTTFMDR